MYAPFHLPSQLPLGPITDLTTPFEEQLKENEQGQDFIEANIQGVLNKSMGVMNRDSDRSYLRICKSRAIMCVYPLLISRNTKEWEQREFSAFSISQLLRIQNSDKA